MALCLNANMAYKDFQMLRNDRYFVDKTVMIEKGSALKADSTPEAAIRQIKEREYCEKLLKEGVNEILLWE